MIPLASTAPRGNVHRRIGALDGLRGLAILLVLMHHVLKVPGGWVGVDLFFVLSGYLITNSLMSERTEPHFWKIFYTRRATRILPPYIALIVGCLLLAKLQWHTLWPYYTFFAANWAFVVHPGLVGPMLVVWSLAVEEHFYFIWPAIVRRYSEKALIGILLGVAIGEPIFRAIAYVVRPMDWKVYYVLTPFRLDGLAMGSLLSILLAKPLYRAFLARHILTALLLCMAACVVFSGVLRQSREANVLSFNIVGYSMLALTSAILLAFLVLRSGGMTARYFANAPLIFVGRVSYGLYIYHMLVREVVIQVAKYLGFIHLERMGTISLPFSLLIAWISFEYFERRFLGIGRQIVDRCRATSTAVTSS